MAAPELVERSKARIGNVLRDKWRLDSLLGVGGSAAVYAATHRNGKRGAIKLLHPELSVQADFVTRFLREGYVANKIEHSGAVSILDDDHTEDGTAFLVMELLEGYTLERRLRKQSAFPVSDALKIVEDLLDIVSAAHDKGIIHRDLKPANIFVTKKNEVKVLDFGIARLGEAHHLSGSTQMGMPLGTPAFMPPEQARGRWGEVDVRTDLWAVGATLWALLSGQRPRRAETANEELLLAMTEPLPPIGSVVPQVSIEVCKLVDRAVAFDMSARWPTAKTMQQALRLALLLEQANTTTSPAPDRPRPRPLTASERNEPRMSTGTIAGLGGYAQVPELSPPSPPTPPVRATPADAAAPAAATAPISGEAPASMTAVRPFPQPQIRSDEAAPVTSLEGPPSLNYGGALSLSRYDALGERRPRTPAATAAATVITPTPSGESRLLTTETPLMTAGARSMLASDPEIAPPRKSGFLLSAVLVAALAGAGFFAYRSGMFGFGVTQASPAPAAPQVVADAGVTDEADAGAALLPAPAPLPETLADADAGAALVHGDAAITLETPAASAASETPRTPAPAPKPRPRPKARPAAGADGGSGVALPPSGPAESGGPTPTPIPPFVDPDTNQL